MSEEQTKIRETVQDVPVQETVDKTKKETPKKVKRNPLTYVIGFLMGLFFLMVGVKFVMSVYFPDLKYAGHNFTSLMLNDVHFINSTKYEAVNAEYKVSTTDSSKAYYDNLQPFGANTVSLSMSYVNDQYPLDNMVGKYPYKIFKNNVAIMCYLKEFLIPRHLFISPNKPLNPLVHTRTSELVQFKLREDDKFVENNDERLGELAKAMFEFVRKIEEDYTEKLNNGFSKDSFFINFDKEGKVTLSEKLTDAIKELVDAINKHYVNIASNSFNSSENRQLNDDDVKDFIKSFAIGYPTATQYFVLNKLFYYSFFMKSDKILKSKKFKNLDEIKNIDDEIKNKEDELPQVDESKKGDIIQKIMKLELKKQKLVNSIIHRQFVICLSSLFFNGEDTNSNDFKTSFPFVKDTDKRTGFFSMSKLRSLPSYDKFSKDRLWKEAEAVYLPDDGN
ncbi:hypothetical protein A0H76_1832 [Hepatospora eriocheir]|uniref:Uncharacterized protein n=1 Tax=Hepatospora eriocheir TaxID=1081669 RepID=A0A1X0QGG6_9MICR|nr:hypothetical protein A0H76_1832 [Hepatospora eriocheir]